MRLNVQQHVGDKYSMRVSGDDVEYTRVFGPLVGRLRSSRRCSLMILNGNSFCRFVPVNSRGGVVTINTSSAACSLSILTRRLLRGQVESDNSKISMLPGSKAGCSVMRGANKNHDDGSFDLFVATAVYYT